ncbi:TATA-binding protein-associated factor 172 [Amphibalanus amphitrite]|uniref:TATA-binding protein-associated factor 172 n=1 Tax=Amphibalanus amphitrite TaxID=1232801 RepID=A0A6A4W5E6_AMPAM|nr:TATA-binding protein-associated factor 172 [Amphibalanus amphitrite]
MSGSASIKPACPEPPLPDSLVHRLHVCLSEPVCYDEMAVSFSRLQQDCRDYLALLRHYNLPVDDSLQNNMFNDRWETARVLSFEQIRQLSGPVSAELLAGVQDSLSAQVTETLQLRQQSVRTASHLVGDEQTCWATRTQMALARPLVLMNRLTDKLNPVVRPLMESIKRETDPRLQSDGPQQHTETEHNTRLTRQEIVANTSIVGRARDRRRLVALEAILIKERDPAINRQLNARGILQLNDGCRLAT